LGVVGRGTIIYRGCGRRVQLAVGGSGSLAVGGRQTTICLGRRSRGGGVLRRVRGGEPDGHRKKTSGT
jgi:hypothetical protein